MVVTTVATTAATTAPAPAPGPPFPVAATTMALVDPSRPTVSRGVTVSPSRALTTTVWSPTAAGRWPLLVFAAGFRVGPQDYSHLGRLWAAAGYVVAAPSFPLADAAVAGPALDEGDLDNEPADVRFVISAITAPSSPVAGRVDAGRIGVAGHSDGAEVALAVAQQPATAIRAVIALAGQPVTAGLGHNPPLLVVQGDADTVNPPERGQAVFDRATGPHFLLTLSGGDHSTPFAAGSRWQAVVDDVTVTFLHRYLAGQPATDDRLLATGNRPGLALMVSAGTVSR